ncbi:hypothetical protein [Sinorhizobium sp. GL28]|nr:hypothetical protein [Sinorhizobium sp. GL28]
MSWLLGFSRHQEPEKQKPPDGGLVEYDQQAAPIGTAKNTRGKWVRS